MSKESVIAAMEKHHKRQLNEPRQSRGKRNKAPERDLTQKPCMKWMRDHKMDVELIEASGGVNQFGGIAVKNGYSDCSGCDRFGYAVYVEFKAPGKIKTLRPQQRDFLEKKIRSNAFAIVTDSIERLDELYNAWVVRRQCYDFKRAQELLLDAMPVIPKRKATRGQVSCPDLDNFLD